MSASMQQRSCSDLGACLARSDCHECGYPIGECQDTVGDGAMCTRVHGISEGTKSAERVQRLINSRVQQPALDRMPMPTQPLHLSTHRATPHLPPAPDAGPVDPLEPPPAEHAPRALLAFWAGYLGFAVVVIGLVAVHAFAR